MSEGDDLDAEGFVMVRNYQAFATGVWRSVPRMHRNLDTIDCGAGRVWSTKWFVDRDLHTDDLGWQYSSAKDGMFTPDPRAAMFRRRRHFRQWRKLVVEPVDTHASMLALQFLVVLALFTFLYRVIWIPSSSVYTYSRWSDDLALVFLGVLICCALYHALHTLCAPTAPVGERAECTAGLDHAGDLSQTSLVPTMHVTSYDEDTPGSSKSSTGGGLSAPRARAKKLLTVATNTSLTALAELADYGIKSGHALEKRRAAAPAEVFIFSLYLDDGDVHDVRTTLGDIWSLYERIQNIAALQDSTRPVSPRMAFAKRMVSGDKDEQREQRRTRAELFAQDVLLAASNVQLPDVRAFFNLTGVDATVVAVECRIEPAVHDEIAEDPNSKA